MLPVVDHHQFLSYLEREPAVGLSYDMDDWPSQQDLPGVPVYSSGDRATGQSSEPHLLPGQIVLSLAQSECLRKLVSSLGLSPGDFLPTSESSDSLPVPSLICSLCRKTFSSVGARKRHEKDHLALEKRHKCTSCPKQFSLLQNLKKHSKVHGPGFRCDFCQKSYAHKASLKQHVQKTHMGLPQQKLECDFCHRFFKNLKVHYYDCIHHPSKYKGPFQCPVCVPLKKYKYKRDWSAHLKKMHQSQ